jgi:hypothetical protein
VDENARAESQTDPRMDVVLTVSPGVTSLPLGDELTVFDPASGRALALNSTAADAFALVDGLATVADIARSLAAAYGRGLDEIVDDVAGLLERLRGEGALSPVVVPPPA